MKLPPLLLYLLRHIFRYITHFIHAHKLEMLVFVIVDCLLLIDYVEGSYFFVIIFVILIMLIKQEYIFPF